MCLCVFSQRTKSRKYQWNGKYASKLQKIIIIIIISPQRVHVEFSVGWKERKYANRIIFLGREGGNREQIFAHYPSRAQIKMRKQRARRWEVGARQAICINRYSVLLAKPFVLENIHESHTYLINRCSSLRGTGWYQWVYLRASEFIMAPRVSFLHLLIAHAVIYQIEEIWSIKNG